MDEVIMKVCQQFVVRVRAYEVITTLPQRGIPARRRR